MSRKLIFQVTAQKDEHAGDTVELTDIVEVLEQLFDGKLVIVRGPKPNTRPPLEGGTHIFVEIYEEGDA